MLEAVGRLGRRCRGGRPARKRPAGRGRRASSASGRRRDRGEQLVGELAADHGADLGDLLDRGEAVEAGHQRVVQRRRDRERRQRAGELVAVARIARAGRIPAPSWSAPRRTAARRRCAPRSARATSAGSALPPVIRSTMRRALAPAEAVERQRGDVGVARPGRLELGPVGEHHQDRQAAHALDQQIEQLQGRRVDPVHVLVQLEHRAVRGRGPPAARSGPRACAASGAAG